MKTNGGTARRDRERLDVLLVQRGLCPSRQKAQAAIIAGYVQVDGETVCRPSTTVTPNARLALRRSGPSYVGRGGVKLAKALDDLAIDVRGKVALDAGASVGGFTDCLLQHGAARVYAVDVGYGQLAWRLRTDPRVRLMERTNIRHVRPEMVGELVDLVTLDLSFISLAKVFAPVRSLLRPGGDVIPLVKPQFEAGREFVGKRGVVRDPGVQADVLERTIAVANAAGFAVLGILHSPLLGPEGNVEYFLHLRATCPESGMKEVVAAVRSAVARAHAELASRKP